MSEYEQDLRDPEEQSLIRPQDRRPWHSEDREGKRHDRLGDRYRSPPRKRRHLSYSRSRSRSRSPRRNNDKYRGHERRSRSHSRTRQRRRPSLSGSRSASSSMESDRRRKEREEMHPKQTTPRSRSRKDREGRRLDQDSHRSCSRSRSPPRKRRHHFGSRSRSRSRSPHRDKKGKNRGLKRRSRSRSQTKHRRRPSVSSSRSSSSSTDGDRRGKRQKEKHRKRSRSRDKDRKEKKKSKKDKKKKGSSTAQWGKYGIINESNMYEKEEEFRTWLVEERKINPEVISKEQTKKEFARFAEDYNTATLPNEKYYNIASFERRMSSLRHGETLPPVDDGYDPDADMRAHSSAHKKHASEKDTYMSAEQLQELRRVQQERSQVGKMKLMGMNIGQSFGVRMDGSAFDG